MQNFKIAVIFFIVGFLASTLIKPKPETKIEYKDKIITKTDIKTVIKEILKPDGSKETETIIVDNSTKKEDSTKTLISFKPQYRITSGIGLNKEWQIGAATRIIGPIFLGLQYNNESAILGTLSWEF